MKLFTLYIYVFLFCSQLFCLEHEFSKKVTREKIKSMSLHNQVFKKILDNGLTILVRPNHIIPKTSLQLWYNVGSKDEKTGEKGIAHLIEHMIFKGTEKLSESDIDKITRKLSGSCNAFTSYDYTGYLFDFPSHHWHEALNIMADCMRNCSFKQDFLNSEMKAVVQELKMYRDSYVKMLVQQMVSTIFADHPYHYPIIGFKQDLWNLKRDALVSFYNHHYIPNNATLVVVGDVKAEEVFAYAQQAFGHIEPDWDYKKEEFYHGTDIENTSVTLYREVSNPIVALAFLVPGARAGYDYVYDILSFILASGKASRLQKKLQDDLQLVTSIETFNYDFFEHGLFFIIFQPKELSDLEEIKKLIVAEIEELITNGVKEQELTRAIKQVQNDYLSVLEDNQKQAYVIGESYLATGDHEYLTKFLEYPVDNIVPALHDILTRHFRACLMHQGLLLPLEQKDKDLWQIAQERSDKEDARILSAIVREVEVEEGKRVHDIKPGVAPLFHFPKPTRFVLPNGLTVLYYHNPSIAKIEAILEFKADQCNDPVELQGLSTFVNKMLLEGTHSMSAQELADAIEILGMTFESKPGFVALSMLSDDVKKGLSLLHEVLTNANFPKKAIEKVRKQMLSELDNFWDNPSQFVGYLARKEVYKNHPYSLLSLGTKESLNAIGQEDLVNAYKHYFSPKEAVLSLVGNLEGVDIKAEVTKIFGDLKPIEVKEPVFPHLEPVQAHEVLYPMNRDQIVLAFAGLSVAREHPDFDALLVFDQILTGGALGAMSSRLFQLRERTGLFYTIGGSLLKNAEDQPGHMFIKTIVSQDRLQEAETAIKQVINTAVATVTEDELKQAKDALKHSLVDNFETNKSIAASFLFLERFNLPDTFFDTRAQQFDAVTLPKIQHAVGSLVDTNNMVTIKIGRV